MKFKYKPDQIVCLIGPGYENTLYNVVGIITEQMPPDIFGAYPVYRVFFENAGHYVVPEHELKLLKDRD